MFFKLITLFLVFNLISGYEYSTTGRYNSFSDWHSNNRHHQRKNMKQLKHEQTLDGSPHPDLVIIQLFYESLCPGCIKFHTMELNSTVAELATQNLVIKTYPYGNANTNVDQTGTVTFTCQHGEAECYGNMLHACAINILGMTTSAITYNSCLMSKSQSNGRSDDSAADECGKLFNVDSEAIKACAKGDKGIKLMKFVSDVTNRTYPRSGTPYVLINGKQFDSDDNFKNAVCKALKNSPKACHSNTLEEE